MFKKITSIVLLIMLLGSNFSFISISNAKENPSPGSEGDFNLLETGSGATGLLPGLQSGCLDLKPGSNCNNLKIEKKAGEILDIGDGVYSIDYTITVTNDKNVGIYTLSDEINVGSGVSITSVSPVTFIDDDPISFSIINPLFDGVNETNIITLETVYLNNSDVYKYTVNYTVDSTATSSDKNCKGNDNLEEIVVVKNNAKFISSPNPNLIKNNGSDEVCIELPIPEKPKINIIANKIVCDNESYLPNWGTGGGDIDENTVQDFLSDGENSQHCWLEKDWKFQWGNEDIAYPGDDFYGEATDGWNTFVSTAQIDAEDISKIRVREVLKEGFIPFTYGTNSNTNIDDYSAEMYCHNDVINYDNYDSVQIDENTDTYYCVAFNVEKPTVNFIADKIVCDDESYLPNWGTGGEDIDENTAQDFLSDRENSKHCWLEDDWNFQWGYNDVTYPGDDFYGEASDGWNTFTGSVKISSENIEQIRIREVLEDGYIPFSGNSDDYSAEIYCHNDVTNYDNYEWINLDNSEDYYCVGFNYKDSTLEEKNPICEDGKKYARITLDEEEGLVPDDNIIWFGDSKAPVGVWFELPGDAQASSQTGGIVFTYGNDTLTLDLLKFSSNERQDFAGTIEFYGAEIDGELLTDSLETTGGHPDVFVKNSNTIVKFDFATTTGDDQGIINLKDRLELCTPVQTGYNEDNGDPYETPRTPDDNEIACTNGTTQIDGVSVHWTQVGVGASNVKYYREYMVGSGSWLGSEIYSNPYTDYRTFGSNEGNYSSRVRAFIDDNNNNILDFEEQFTPWSNICEITYGLPRLPEVDPGCEDEIRYAKITINEASGGLVTHDNNVWLGDYIVPLGAWFILPNDVETSTQTQGAVLTYDNYNLTIDLLKDDDDAEQDFAGRIEFYGAKVSGDLVEGRSGDSFYDLEDGTGGTHLDIFEKESNTVIDFDFATTTKSDEGSFKLKDKIEYCNEPFKIVARKIVCEDEADLPDYFGGDLDEINRYTGKRWVSSHESCQFVEGWEFQYGVNDVESPSGDFLGEASNWTTFGPTNSNGKTVFSTRNLEDVNKVNIREVLQDGFIPFSDTINPTGKEYSAELYCGTDIGNYDNLESIEGESLGYGKTVQCVAWNVPKGADPLNKCENDFTVNNGKELSIIDLTTGTQTYVNDLEFGSSAAAVDPVTGNIYYLEYTKGNSKLGVYNITDHTNTVVGNTYVQKAFTKMAFDINGVLYAMTDYKNSSLYTINTSTGLATYIDATPLINKDGGDFVFDDKGDLYVIVKDGKFYKVAITSSNTSATFMGNVKYDGNNIQSTGLVFKNGLFYVTDNDKKLYSFSLDDIGNATKISKNTNSINDLASCPVGTETPEPEFGSIGGYKFNDINGNSIWEQGCPSAPGSCYTEGTLSGWNITITGDSYSGTTLTNDNGYYYFDTVPVGEYTICETQQSGWTQTYPDTDDGCHIVNITTEQTIDYNFGNEEETIIEPPVIITGGGGSSKASCQNLELTSDLGTGSGEVDLKCSGDKDTKAFMIDCGDGSEKQIKNALGSGNTYANFTCNYDDTTKSYDAICSVSKKETTDVDSSQWRTTKDKCELDITFNTLTTFKVEEIIVASGEEEEEEEEEPEENTDNIKKAYDDYLDKLKKLKGIISLEKEQGKNLISLPEILLKTGTPIAERVSKIEDSRIELDAPSMVKSYINDINVWKMKLPEIDRDRDEYIVVPSNGLVVPVNYIPETSTDYSKIINGTEIDVNEYLKTGVVSYPGTSLNDYGDIGNKVIFGHSSYWKSDDGRYKSHFQKIIELDVGEEVWVYKIQSNGEFKRFVYEVNESFETQPTNVSVLNPGVGSNLTLVTCTPIGTIEGRWIVKAKFVNEDKSMLEDYIYGNKVSAKYKKVISKTITSIEKLDNAEKREVTLKLFSRIETLENDVKNNSDLSNLLSYFKLKLAISFYETD